VCVCGNLRAYIYKDLTEYERDQAVSVVIVVNIVEGPELPQSITHGEHHGAKRVQAYQPEAVVAAGK
jgi:hypothetical protein